jgi:DNA-binding NarL/FixJ family response regulator
MNPKTILIVDDHEIFRQGLKEIIRHWDEFVVIGEASNGQEAIEQVKKTLPDIVFMDISMPVMDGLEATKKIWREFPSTSVVMLTVAEGGENLFQAIRNGASGYISKNVSSETLYELLNDMAHGEAALTSDMAKKIIDEFKVHPENKKYLAEVEPLSEKEMEVLKLVVEGYSNPEIAERLFLSVNTIKKYIRNILQKLHLKNRIEAAVYAIREGLIE